ASTRRASCSGSREAGPIVAMIFVRRTPPTYSGGRRERGKRSKRARPPCAQASVFSIRPA
ncbi:MAG TPA: hypothetical protein VK387_02945, partial [Thermoleophilaceae bacterium]|nr:hypothetical protein [Thermoleophilaceae bacterium]